LKIKELIEKLQGFDPELMVVRPGYEGGVTELQFATEVTLALNVNKEWYYGEHDTVKDIFDWPEHQHAQGVNLT
jgi:hypothetical protein